MPQGPRPGTQRTLKHKCSHKQSSWDDTAASHYIRDEYQVQGAGEKGQQPRARVALVEDQCSVPRIHFWLTSIHSPSSRGPKRHTQGAHACTQAKHPYTHRTSCGQRGGQSAEHALWGLVLGEEAAYELKRCSRPCEKTDPKYSRLSRVCKEKGFS